MARRTARRLGDGSIFYDKARRRWVAMVSLPTTDGTRRRLRRTFPTRGEAEAFLGEQNSPLFSLSADLTVADLLDGWQDWVRRKADAGQLAVSTVELYELCVPTSEEGWVHGVQSTSVSTSWSGSWPASRSDCQGGMW